MLVYQRKSGVRGLVHSDDGFFCGPRWALKRLEKELQQYFEIRSQIVGPCIDEGDKQECTVLNRLLRYTPDGWEWEADPRLAQSIVDSYDGEFLHPYTTPGKAGPIKVPGFDRPITNPETVRQFRSRVQKSMFLSHDREDIMFTSKELARWSSRPTAGCLEGMKHMAGYISANMRVVYKFRWRDPEPKRKLVVKVDTDFAGCLVTRRSTSGGCLMLNNC